MNPNLRHFENSTNESWRILAFVAPSTSFEALSIADVRLVECEDTSNTAAFCLETSSTTINTSMENVCRPTSFW